MIAIPEKIIDCVLWDGTKYVLASNATKEEREIYVEFMERMNSSQILTENGDEITLDTY